MLKDCYSILFCFVLFFPLSGNEKQQLLGGEKSKFKYLEKLKHAKL